MKRHEPEKITLQWNGEVCRICERALSIKELVWAQTHQFNRRSFWCLKDGNFKFEEKSDMAPTQDEEASVPKYCQKHKHQKIPCKICDNPKSGFIEKIRGIIDETTDDFDDLDSISTKQWPPINLIEYAIENMKEHANREELKKYKMKLTKKGLLYQFRGAFAVIYKGIDAKKQEYALRLFTFRNVKAMNRYSKLSAYFEKNKIYDSTYFTEFKYLPRAVEIFINTKDDEEKRMESFPIIRMSWVNGESLENLIKETNSVDDIKKLAKNFLNMVNKLEELKIAHGDLHPKNILVNNELNLRLVDYDCIYINDFEGESQPEGGDPDCQHPQRGNFKYDEKLDRFSALVIYLGLLAISENIDLKSHKDSGEFPFSQEDFVNPTSSELFLKLEKLNPIVSFLTKKLSHYCKSDEPKINSVKELLKEFKHNEKEELGSKEI